jgi:hypothetical protein
MNTGKGWMNQVFLICKTAETKNPCTADVIMQGIPRIYPCPVQYTMNVYFIERG